MEYLYTQRVEFRTKGKAERINMMLEANVPECSKLNIFRIPYFHYKEEYEILYADKLQTFFKKSLLSIYIRHQP